MSGDQPARAADAPPTARSYEAARRYALARQLSLMNTTRQRDVFEALLTLFEHDYEHGDMSPHDVRRAAIAIDQALADDVKDRNG